MTSADPPVYLDYNASAPLKPCARETLLRILDEGPGNPSSVHADGVRTRAHLDDARAVVASILGARAEQIVFTSGGTESNNLAILGAAAVTTGPVVSLSIEHPSVLAALDRLELQGREVRRIPPGEGGVADPKRLVSALDDASSGIVTVQLVNHETGARHPVEQIRPLLRDRDVVLHVDAVQAFCKIPFDVASLGADLVSLSGHKIGAPVGVGVLFVRDPKRLRPRQVGGPQEWGLRAGTPSVALAASFAAAAEEAVRDLDVAVRRASTMRDKLVQAIEHLGHPVVVQTPLDRSVPTTLCLSFPGADRAALLVNLDLLGFRVSPGSACASGSARPSEVLLAMGRPLEEAASAIRVSFGPPIEESSLLRFAAALGCALERASSSPINPR